MGVNKDEEEYEEENTYYVFKKIVKLVYFGGKMNSRLIEMCNPKSNIKIELKTTIQNENKN